MFDSETRPLNVVCLATYFKGVDFIRECKRRGCQVVLITKEKALGEDWPHESLDDLVALPNDAGPDLFIHLVSLLARQTKIDRIVALEEFDVITAAQIREHFCLPGMSSATARLFRDKLAMSAKVKEAGINVPDFVSLLNHDEVRDFVERVPPPWVIKPRSDVSAIGIKKGEEPGDVWRAIDELDRRERLRERSPHHLLSQFISGDVFHIDSLVSNARVIFAGANKYGRPPMDVAHKGGAYISHTIPRGTEDEKRLFAINRKLLKTLGLETGAAHAEFIRSTADGEFYFLEVAARVGGAYIADVLEAASGLNLWREWARLELADKPTRANLLPPRKEYAGIVLSLAKQEYPDTSSYDDPEVVYRVKKKHHAGLIVRSKKLDRVQELLTQYATRFTQDFEAVLPPLERAE
ncbi:MAG: ATP-grasp domain-containing protein [Pyrinomonadaceae bacterium]|nr:ATP-grasp domain-containing protein [Pyrinomonadaceae bacterium]